MEYKLKLSINISSGYHNYKVLEYMELVSMAHYNMYKH